MPSIGAGQVTIMEGLACSGVGPHIDTLKLTRSANSESRTSLIRIVMYDVVSINLLLSLELRMPSLRVTKRVWAVAICRALNGAYGYL